MGNRETDGRWCISCHENKYRGEIIAVGCGISDVIKALCNFRGVAHLLLKLILSCRSGYVVAYITRQGTRRLELIIVVKLCGCANARDL